MYLVHPVASVSITMSAAIKGQGLAGQSQPMHDGKHESRSSTDGEIQEGVVERCGKFDSSSPGLFRCVLR